MLSPVYSLKLNETQLVVKLLHIRVQTFFYVNTKHLSFFVLYLLRISTVNLNNTFSSQPCLVLGFN